MNSRVLLCYSCECKVLCPILVTINVTHVVLIPVDINVSFSGTLVNVNVFVQNE